MSETDFMYVVIGILIGLIIAVVIAGITNSQEKQRGA